MEIKLTTDWILMYNSEIDTINGVCFLTIYGELHHHLVELALKTMNVNYEYEEVFDDGDETWENPHYRYSFENIEDIKESCTELYDEFQRSILNEIAWEKEINRKQSIILSFLDTPKTLRQIHAYVKTEFYKTEEKDYITLIKFLKTHTNYLIDDLIENDLIRKNKNQFEKI